MNIQIQDNFYAQYFIKLSAKYQIVLMSFCESQKSFRIKPRINYSNVLGKESQFLQISSKN